MKKRLWWSGVGGALLVLVLLAPVPAQMNGITPDGEGLSSYPGPLGRVSEHRAHAACKNCFTVPSLDRYQIFEKINTAGGVVLLPRMIPNPAPYGGMKSGNGMTRRRGRISGTSAHRHLLGRPTKSIGPTPPHGLLLN